MWSSIFSEELRIFISHDILECTPLISSHEQYTVSPNSAFIHILVSQHISANQNFFHLGIFRYIEICLTKVSFFQLCLLWDQNQFHVAVCLVYGLQWFWHLTFRRNWFMNAAPLNHIWFCSSFFLFNLADYLEVGYKNPSK